MTSSAVAKYLGWGQLVLVALQQAIAANGIPHTANAWLTLLGSAALAVAVHHASSTDGTK
jgi:hypothetical protein